MIQFLPLALQLAAKIPAVNRLLSGAGSSEAKEEVAKVAVNFLSDKLGVESNNLLSTIISTPATAAQADDLVTTYHDNLLKVAHENMQSARDMYVAENGSKSQTDAMATQIMRYNVWFILALVAVQCVCMYYFQERGELLALLGNVVGLVIGALISERSSVVAFYFASMDGVEKLLSKDSQRGK